MKLLKYVSILSLKKHLTRFSFDFIANRLSHSYAYIGLLPYFIYNLSWMLSLWLFHRFLRDVSIPCVLPV